MGYVQDFDSLAVGSDPPEWLDTAPNRSLEPDDSLFRVWGSENHWFGTVSTATNIHSHFVGNGASQWNGFEYTGRMRIGVADGGIGVTFFSQFPNEASYYRLRRYNGAPTESEAEFGAFYVWGVGTAMTSGVTDTGVVPTPGNWYRFRIQVVDTGLQTEVRANVWLDGTTEPTAWQVDATDDSVTRLTSGTIGVWSFFSGGKDWDDLRVTPLASVPAIDWPNLMLLTLLLSISGSRMTARTRPTGL